MDGTKSGDEDSLRYKSCTALLSSLAIREDLVIQLWRSTQRNNHIFGYDFLFGNKANEVYYSMRGGRRAFRKRVLLLYFNTRYIQQYK